MKLTLWYSTITLFVCLLVLSCRKTDHLVHDLIIEQTIDSVLTFATEPFVNVDSFLLVHQEIYPDNSKSIVLKRAIETRDFKEYKSIVIELLTVLDDTVNHRFVNYKNGNIQIIEYDPLNHDYLNHRNFFGTVNLSNSISDGKIGCYYFGLNCGDECSAGFLVKTFFDGTNWKVGDISILWYG